MIQAARTPSPPHMCPFSSKTLVVPLYHEQPLHCAPTVLHTARFELKLLSGCTAAVMAGTAVLGHSPVLLSCFRIQTCMCQAWCSMVLSFAPEWFRATIL